MQAELQGLHTRPSHFTYLGALGGCLDYLGIEASTPWLAGGTGLAFAMCMDASVDPAAPIAWGGLCGGPCRGDRPFTVDQLSPNLGYQTRDVCSCPYGKSTDIDGARGRAWDLVREAISDGWPCIGYELAAPEFYLITGHDDEGYTFLKRNGTTDTETAAGPVPWQEVGRLVQWTRFQAVSPGSPAPDGVVVREALSVVADAMADPPREPAFVFGLAGYDLWAQALTDGTAGGFGHRYNAATWGELKAHAATFLREARDRLPGHANDLLDETIRHYQTVADKLQALQELRPFTEAPDEERIRSNDAAQLVREAGAAEREGLRLLRPIAQELQ